MTTALGRRVRRRAQGRCEYCRLPQTASNLTFPIDHIIARQHGGETRAENLALSCAHCNAHKGPNLAGIDPQDGTLVRLYHPRRNRWPAHFEWRGAELVGRSPIGRVTVHVLAMNDPAVIELREALIEEGAFHAR